jgi:penicillin-binding protein 1A
MSPLEMAGGYTALANNGLYTKPYAYTEVIHPDEGVLLDNKSPEFTSVFKPETAFMMTDILVETVESYGGQYRVINGAGEYIRAAAKSGTTDENVDRWLVGYTPYYTAAVWYGYDNLLTTISVPSTDHYSPFDIWFDAMNRIHASLPPKSFDVPSSIRGVKICRTSGLLPVEGQCPDVITEYFVAGSHLIPSQSCTVHAPKPTPSPMPTIPIDPNVTPVPNGPPAPPPAG